MPIIMTVHMTNVNSTSAARQGCSIAMPMSAIIRSYSIDADIW